MKNLVSAIFETKGQANTAVENLVEAGVPRSAISYAGRDGAEGEEGNLLVPNADDNVDAPSVVRGVALGGAFGALLSIAVLAIPFVGPAIAAGAIGSALIPGVAISGALLGGAIGGIQQALIDHGFNADDATYYSEHLDKGGVLISVDADASGNTADIAQILEDAGGKRRDNNIDENASTDAALA